MSTTMRCAKCHDHKGDPILQADYYSMRAFFEQLQDTTLKNIKAHFKDPSSKARSEAAIKGAEAEIAKLWASVDKNKLNTLATPAADSSHQHKAIIPFAYDGFHVAWQVTDKKPSEPGWSLPSYSGKGFKESGLPLRHGNPGPEFAGVAKPWGPKQHTLYLRKDFGLTTIPGRFVVYTRGTAERITVLINGNTIYSGPAHTAGKLRYYPFKKSDMGHLTTGKNTLGLIVHSPKPHKYLNAAVFPHLFHPVSPELYAEHFPDELITLYGQDFIHKISTQRQAITSARDQITHKGMPYMTQLENRVMPKSYIHRRGSVHAPGDEVFPGVPLVLAESAEAARIPITGDYQKTRSHGRRLALARWITSKENPLTARVAANRIWHHLFGRGIVPTVDDFGPMGIAPSNPMLLDSLAASLIEGKWSQKKLIRQIVLSKTYRQSATPHSDLSLSYLADTDPENILLHKSPVRRLQAEAIRDSMLAISGRLDRKLFGNSVPVYITSFMQGRGRPRSGPLDGAGRRSIYTSIRRNFLPPMMLAFDMPSPFSSVARRTVSNVPAQALTLMNDPFVVSEAKRWADSTANIKDTKTRINTMFLQASARRPSPEQMKTTLAWIESHPSQKTAWVDFAHSVWNTKEFIFLN